MAAIRIQSRVRGFQARKRWRPLIRHHAFLNSQAKKLQRPARRWLGKRWIKRLKVQRRVDAATDIQRIWHGCKGRRRAAVLGAKREKRDARRLANVLKLQSWVRAAFACQELRRRKSAAHLEARQRSCERQAAVKIQAHRRGVQVRLETPLDTMRKEKLESNVSKIQFIQAQIQRFGAQGSLGEKMRRSDAKAKLRQGKATMIQKHWRGWLARRYCEQLLDTYLWPGEEQLGEDQEYGGDNHSDDARSVSEGSYLDADQMMSKQEQPAPADPFPVKDYVHKGLAAHKDRMAKAAQKAALVARLREEPEPEERPRLPPSIYGKRQKPPPGAWPSKSQANGPPRRGGGKPPPGPQSSPAKEAEKAVMGKARRMVEQRGAGNREGSAHRDNAAPAAPAARESPAVSSRRSPKPPLAHPSGRAAAPQAAADRERDMRNWHQRKDKESQARREQDAQDLQDLVAKSRGKEEALRRMEQARLEERTRRLKIGDKRKNQAMVRHTSMPVLPPLLNGLVPTQPSKHQKSIAEIMAGAGQGMPRQSSTPALPRLRIPQPR